MGSIWGDVAADRERRRHKQRQAEERFRRAVRADEARARRAAAVTERAERAEQARRDRAEREAQAARLDAELQADVAGLTGLLRAAAAEPARNLAVFRRTAPVEEPPRIEEVAGSQRPQWSQFSPDQPAGLFGRRLYERALVDARARFERALTDHDRQRQEVFAGVFREYQERVLRRTREQSTRPGGTFWREPLSPAIAMRSVSWRARSCMLRPRYMACSPAAAALSRWPAVSSCSRSTYPTPMSSRSSVHGSISTHVRLSNR